jgi:hypothetical protein
MTLTREVLHLPLLFLTVALLGGVRVTDRVALLPPPLLALVLGVLMLGVLIRGGALALERLMHASRSTLANWNGSIVLAAIFFASAQVFNLVTPDSGLPRVIVSVFLFILLFNTLAASHDRVSVIRSLVVIFGSAFILKFIVLAALSDPEGGRVKRALLALLDGLTLGTLTQGVVHPATGYLAFLTLVLFIAGLALLPSADPLIHHSPVTDRRTFPMAKSDARLP